MMKLFELSSWIVKVFLSNQLELRACFYYFVVKTRALSLTDFWKSCSLSARCLPYKAANIQIELDYEMEFHSFYSNR